MADRVRKVNYTYVMVPHRPGRGAEVLARPFVAERVAALSAFPAEQLPGPQRDELVSLLAPSP